MAGTAGICPGAYAPSEPAVSTTVGNGSAADDGGRIVETGEQPPSSRPRQQDVDAEDCREETLHPEVGDEPRGARIQRHGESGILRPPDQRRERGTAIRRSQQRMSGQMQVIEPLEVDRRQLERRIRTAAR